VLFNPGNAAKPGTCNALGVELKLNAKIPHLHKAQKRNFNKRLRDGVFPFFGQKTGNTKLEKVVISLLPGPVA
jgi:hypothetical protein